MIVLAIVLLLMGLFSTTIAIVYKDLSMWIPAGLCYLPCWAILVRMSKEIESESEPALVNEEMAELLERLAYEVGSVGHGVAKEAFTLAAGIREVLEDLK